MLSATAADGPGSCGFEGPVVIKLVVCGSAASFQNRLESVGGSMIDGASATSVGGAGVSSIGGAGVSSVVGESDEGPEIGSAGSAGV